MATGPSKAPPNPEKGLETRAANGTDERQRCPFFSAGPQDFGGQGKVEHGPKKTMHSVYAETRTPSLVDAIVAFIYFSSLPDRSGAKSLMQELSPETHICNPLPMDSDPLKYNLHINFFKTGLLKPHDIKTVSPISHINQLINFFSH